MQYKVLGTAMLNLKYPLFKQTELDKNYLTPMASLRYSPSKGMNLKMSNADNFKIYSDLMNQ